MNRANNVLRRVLLYSHDTYGLGHLRRNLAIAEHLLGQHPHLQIVLMTGSSVADRYDTPPRLQVVQLPPVVKVGDEDYRSRDPRWSTDLVQRSRCAIMKDTARRFRPDVFLVDHAPQGMKKELLPVFDELRASSPRTRIVLGLRDVIDAPQVVRANWSRTDTYQTLEAVYDRILVYGSAELFDVVSLYGLPDVVASKLTYCGYVSRRVDVRREREDVQDFVLGVAGGGGDGARVLSTTLRASEELGRRCVVMTGPLMSRSDHDDLARQVARHPDARLVDFVADPSDMMRRARVVVTMGGYNSLCELVALGTPTVVIPRVEPRREQAIRAKIFAQLGVVALEMPGEDLTPRLRETLERVLGSPDAGSPDAGPSVARAAQGQSTPGGSAPALDLHGLTRVDAALVAEARLSRPRGSDAWSSRGALEATR